jgi:hypothetical protein
MWLFLSYRNGINTFQASDYRQDWGLRFGRDYRVFHGAVLLIGRLLKFHNPFGYYLVIFKFVMLLLLSRFSLNLIIDL